VHVRAEDGAVVKVGHDDAAFDAGRRFVGHAEPEGVDLRLVGGEFEGFIQTENDKSPEPSNLRVGQGLDDDLRPDPGRVAHGDAHQRLGVGSIRHGVGKGHLAHDEVKRILVGEADPW